MAGYDLDHATHRTRVVSATGEQFAPLAFVELRCLGHTRFMYVTAHDLPSRIEGHGLLGHDFLSDGTLTIDYPRTTVSFRDRFERRPWWRPWG